MKFTSIDCNITDEWAGCSISDNALVEKTDSGIEEGKIEGVELIELKNISKQYRE